MFINRGDSNGYHKKWHKWQNSDESGKPHCLPSQATECWNKCAINKWPTMTKLWRVWKASSFALPSNGVLKHWCQQKGPNMTKSWRVWKVSSLQSQATVCWNKGAINKWQTWLNFDESGKPHVLPSQATGCWNKGTANNDQNDQNVASPDTTFFIHTQMNNVYRQPRNSPT